MNLSNNILAQTLDVDLWCALQAITTIGSGSVTRRGPRDQDITLTPAQLVEHAQHIASQLITAGAQTGDCVMLVVGDPLAFACGFWACQAAGLAAVPMPPMGSDMQQARTMAALGVLENAWIIADDRATQDALSVSEHSQGAFLLTGDTFGTLEGLDAGNHPLPKIDSHAISVVMFSSGSTGAPKGVDLSHRAIMAQVALLQKGLSLTPSDRFMNWMPMSHDFGLFHFHILPLLSAVPQMLMAPEEFSRRPISWVRAMSDFKATHSGAPNLALEIVANVIKPERAAQFNLSHMRGITLGAEPLVPANLTRFADALVDAKLSPSALQPAYGLAEATLVISMRAGLETITVSRQALEPGCQIKLLDTDAHDAIVLPLLGRAIDCAEMRIVNNDGSVLDVHKIGHVQVRSGALMQGYRNSPDQTKAALLEDGWLDTGDIGFIHNGEFVMVGRTKDVIISGGRNYHPADLERVAQTAPVLPSPAPQVAIVQGRDPVTGQQKTIAFFRIRGKKLDLNAQRQAITTHFLAQTGVTLDDIYPIRDLPRTTSGKIQRHALVGDYESGVFVGRQAVQDGAENGAGAPLRAAVAANDLKQVTALVTQAACALTGAQIAAAEPLMDQGLSSRQSMALCAQIGGWLSRDISIARLFDHPSAQAFAQYLVHDSDESFPTTGPAVSQDAISVIGYGCRFPGGDTADAFWQFLNAPTKVALPIPPSRWTSDTALPPAALLSDIDSFDAALFGLSQAEAEAMNPLQRLLLDVLWQAIEQAGLDITKLAGKRVGLFIGLSETGLATGRAETLPDPDAQAGYAVVGSAGSIAVGRIAHLFDFRGPAMAVDTACSSSLTALDLAAQSLANGRCDLAIAGGANLILSPDLHAGLANMGALSPDGLCKTFDEAADGYGRGEGAGLVILKRAADSQRDADCVAAELIATAINHDGESQSVTAPNGRAQRDLIRRALEAGNLAGDDLDWVETHGTGTAIGDPIELDAIETVLRGKGGGPLPLGAVKGVIGHLEAAAGIAGVIKILLAMKHGFVPANRPAGVLNDRFAWGRNTLSPNAHGFAWSSDDRRRAGVASFGMSGTNAYAILSDVAAPEQSAQITRPCVLPLSALSQSASSSAATDWAAKLTQTSRDQHAALAAGQATRRVAGNWRSATVLGAADFAAPEFKKAFEQPNIIFAFPGQGAQIPAMGAALYQTEPAFQAAFDAASDAAGLIAGRSLVDWLFSEDPADGNRLAQTELAQPALVAFGYAMTAYWATFGLRPDAAIGHSVGEIGAALAAGALSLVDAMSLAVARGRIMQDHAPEGAMLALRASLDAAENLIKNHPSVCVAGINGPMSVTLSGPQDGIDAVAAAAQALDMPNTHIAVSRAFHSAAMKSAADALAAQISLPAHTAMAATVYSTLTGQAADVAALSNVNYWHQQMLSPVQFTQAVACAAREGDAIFIEMGPSGMLSRLGPAIAPAAAWVSGANTQDEFAAALGDAWARGAAVDWFAWFGTRGAAGDSLPRHPQTRSLIPRRPVGKAAHAPAPMVVETNIPSAAPTADALPDILPILARISGVSEDQIDPTAPLTTLGLDSLAMVQVQRALVKQTGLDIELKLLFEGAETPQKITDLVAASRPAPAPVIAEGVPTGSGGMAAVFQSQLKLVEDLIAKQFEVLQGGNPMPKQQPAAVKAPVDVPKIKGLFSKSSTANANLTQSQKDHIARLSRAWNDRSAGSKAGAEAARKHVANSRTVFGYTPETKDLTYPLLTDKADGAYVWDVDGSKYIDITMGFGTCLFGHNAPFIKNAVMQELEKGAALGPATPLAEKVAGRINALTGAERSAFFSTGTEAIMCAVRIARAVTGRPRIVVFRGAYHGSFDGVLATGWIDPDGTPQSAPMTDGTLQGMIDPVISLDYGDPASLDVIKRYANEIALVLVEPVQSRDPENRPFDFLREVRQVTQQLNVPLLLDEIISGFRFSPGGMQAELGIQADFVTYGKVLGHGLPIGVLSGQARFMDAVDGGMWRYGDDSNPGPRTAFVAGTFNGHPLSLAAADAVLQHVEHDGGTFQKVLAERTENLCQRLDQLFLDNDVPVHMARYGSLFRFEFSPGTEILNTHLLNNGIFVWEQRNCFLSTAHSDEDLDQIVQATANGIAALKKDQWFGTEAEITPSVGEIALRRQAGLVRQGHWTDMVLLKLTQKHLNPDLLAQHWQTICSRHPALNACLAPDSKRRVADAAAGVFEAQCIADLAQDFDIALDQWAQTTLELPFAFDRAPITLNLLDHGDAQAIVLVASHLAYDGWSLVLVLSELFALLDDRALDDVSPTQEAQTYARWEKEVTPYRLPVPPAPLLLPVDGENPDAVGARGARLTDTSLAPIYQQMAKMTAQSGVTPLAGFLAAFVVMLAAQSRQSTISVAVPVSGQALSGCTNLIGNLSFLRPISVTLSPEMTFSSLRAALHTAILAPGINPPGDAMPDRHAIFNLDGPLALAGQEATLHPAPIAGARADVFANILILDGAAVLDFDWNADRFSQKAAKEWMDQFIALATLSIGGDPLVGDILPLQDYANDVPTAQIKTNTIARAFSSDEAQLATLWNTLLGKTVIDPQAHFIDEGGDSLQAVRLSAQINAQYGVTFGVDQVFEHAVLEDMANAIAIASKTAATLPALQRPLPNLVPALPQQQQLRLLEDSSDAGPAYNIAVQIDLAAQLTLDTVRAALMQLSDRHAVLRTTFDWDEDGLTQIIHAQSAHDVPLAEIVADKGSVDAFAQASFGVDALAWRVGMAGRGGATTLIIVLHHIISDAWSIEIFVRDLLDACQRVHLNAPDLAPLARDYPDYALWHAQSDDNRTADIAYWQGALSNAPALTALPSDQPRPAIKSFAGSRASKRLSDTLFRQLQDAAHKLRATPYQIILAALGAETAHQVGSDDIVIGTVSAGRGYPGMTDTVGFFANTLPLRLQIPAHCCWRDRIALGRAALHAATAHYHVGLQDIAQAANIASDPSANPLFELCLTHDDRRGLTQMGADFGFTFAELELPTSQFDVSAYVVETGASLTIDVTYATAIHDSAYIETLIENVIRHVKAICADPEQSPIAMAAPNELQKRLWFVDQFENGVLYPAAPTYYNMAAEYRCDPTLVETVIAKRFNTALASDTVLKRSFDMNADMPKLQSCAIPVQFCQTLGADDVDAFIAKPFDLSAPPLVRIAHVPDSGKLLIVAHHIIADQHGLDRIANAILTGDMPAVSSDTASATNPKDLAFWRANLGENPPRLLLPADHPRAAVHVYRPVAADTLLDAVGVQALLAFASATGLSQDDIITGAFCAFLQRLSGQDTIVFGKTQARTAGSGPRENLVTLQVALKDGEPASGALADIAQVAKDAALHGQTDFDVVVRDLKPDNDMSRTALFDVLLVRDVTPHVDRSAPVATGWGKYDLVLAVLPSSDGQLQIRLTANAEMFDQATVDGWARILRQILRALPLHADTPIATLPLLPPNEMAEALAKATPTQPFNDAPTITTAFAQQVLAIPDGIAVKHGKTVLTFKSLDDSATKLARVIMAQGIVPGDHVAILLPRGEDYICAMLAVLKAGAVFIPLDLQAPPERTALILEDAQASLVISTDENQPNVPVGIPVLNPHAIGQQSGDPLPCISLDDPAYIIFTSGSTGRPKGVVVAHRNLTSLVLGQGGLFAISQGDVWSWFHSPAFDFSIWEVWGALLTGGTVAPVPEEIQRDLGEVRHFLIHENVTQLSLTPSAFRALSDVEMTCDAGMLSINAVWFGGEALVPNALKSWANRYPDCKLLNLFGITETTVHTTYRALNMADLDRTDSPIGIALPSYSVSLRDPDMQPVPAGVQGEIVVGGTGVAQGYLNRPDQTAARFVDDPATSGARLYRSGDLARQSHDGALTYLGRADSQIKLRGYRIELGEVEAAFQRFDGINAAAAGLLGDGGNDAILAVWLVTDACPDPDVLNAHLMASLPAYMLPKQIFVIDAIPLTLNGKTDRAALAQATGCPLNANENKAMPRHGLETQIADVLCGVLDVAQIGRDDSFFTLGGHSLMANKAVLRLRKELQLDLSLRDFFTAQTVAGIATHCGQSDAIAVTTTITPQDPRAQYPLSSAQTRLFAIQSADPANTAYNVVGGMIIEGALDRTALAGAFVDLIARHEILRTRFGTQSGSPYQVVDPAPHAFDLPLLDMSAAPEAEIITLALAGEFAHVFDLSHGPLLRASLGELAKDRWLLVINLHHIVSDGWSVPIMISDLSSYYQARLDKDTAELSPLNIQYRDYACWQHEVEHDNAAVARACDHLSGYLKAAEPTTTFHADLPRQPQRKGHGAMARRGVSAQDSAALRGHLATQGSTLFSASAAALHMLLRLRGIGDDDAPTIIGTADAGRDAMETEDQIGFYLNLLPHVMCLPASAANDTWTAQSTVETAAMLGNKSAPFEQVIDRIGLDPEPGHTPLFDVLLIVQSNAQPVQTVGPHKAVFLPDETCTCRYDLNIMVEDRDAIEVLIEYDTALHTAATVDALLDEFLTLLVAALTDPTATPLSILAPAAAQANVQGMLDDDDPLLGGL